MKIASVVLVIADCLLLFAILPNQAKAKEVDFNRDIRPLLAEYCLQCHGPDANQRQGDLRLDVEAEAKKIAIVMGAPDLSPVMLRMNSEDASEVMPPVSTGKTLTSSQKNLFREWIEQGAKYQSHWAFEPIRESDSILADLSPPIGDSPAVNSDHHQIGGTVVDRFLRRELSKHGMDYSPEVDRAQLIRRATFDLTGLPPTWQEMEAFVNDREAASFERLIDRLLESPRYGERWGRYWLDIARYADTHGGAAIGFTSFAFSYTYRDYVIQAFNNDLSMDQFIVDQLAADQLGRPKDDPSLAALGFLTVGMQFRNYHDTIDDQIDVISRGLMGLTVTCARCHDHKFDSIPTTDYYALYATIAPSKAPVSLPVIGGVSDQQALQKYQQQFGELNVKHHQFAREQNEVMRNRLRMQVGMYLVEIAKGAKEQDLSTQFLSYRTDDLRPLILNRWIKYLNELPKNDPVFGPWLELEKIANSSADEFQTKCHDIVDRMSKELDAAGLTTDSLNALRSEPPPWNPLVLQAIKESKPNSLIELAEVYGRVFSETQKAWLVSLTEAAIEASTGGTVIPDDHPKHGTINSPVQRQLRHHLYSPGSPLDLQDDEASRLTNRTINDLINGKRAAIHQLNLTSPGAPPRAMVLNEDPHPQASHVFLRGNPLARGQTVVPRFLSALGGSDANPFQDGQRRLALAKAIISHSNPLTRRVIVNWAWQKHFGSGLVRTPDDFGTRGQPPTHPELLDYLADQFGKNGWSMKWLHRQIMMSQAYRQGAIENPQNRQKDPENRWLWRMPRRRLDFEAMRDAMLFVSGELDQSMGGRPVDLNATPAIPRRSVYGFVNRDIIANLMSTFDAANPNACTAQRPETTVPQQTLFALNSEFIQDRAMRLANISVQTGQKQDKERVVDLFQRVFGRYPSELELIQSLKYLESAKTPSLDSIEAERVAESKWIQLAHAMLASNEFTFLD